MASVHVVIATVSDRAATGSTLPVEPAAPDTSKTIASTGSSVIDATLVATEGQVWDLDVSGGSVWAAFGASPNAAANPRRLLRDGVYQFGANAGEKIAILTAA